MSLAGKNYFTEAQAADYCCVSLTQFRLRAPGNIAHFWSMGKKLYRRVDCDRYLEHTAAQQWQHCENAEETTSSSGRAKPTVTNTASRASTGKTLAGSASEKPTQDAKPRRQSWRPEALRTAAKQARAAMAPYGHIFYPSGRENT